MKKPKKQLEKKFACGRCGTKYTREKYAIDCEGKSIEETFFSVGDIVISREKEPWHEENAKPYYFVGHIIGLKIIPPDHEVIKKYFKNDRKRRIIHNRLYIVSSNKRSKDGIPMYYPEIKNARNMGLRTGKHYKIPRSIENRLDV